MSYNLYQIHPANSRVTLLTTELEPPLRINVEQMWLKRFEVGDIALVTSQGDPSTPSLSTADVVWAYTVHEVKTKALGK